MESSSGAMRPGPRRILAWAVSLVVVLSAGEVCLAKNDFNVTLRVGWGGYYRPQEWIPLEINISNPKLKKELGAVAVLTAQQDGLNVLSIRQGFSLTKDDSKDLWLVTKLAFAVSDMSLEIVDQKSGRPKWRGTYNLASATTGTRLRSVNDSDLLIGTSGRVSGSLVRLGDNAYCEHGYGNGRVLVAGKLQAKLPRDWSGYASLDALVLYDPDWTTIRPATSKAIVQWVRKGGRLLIVLGANPLPATHPIADLLGFRPARPTLTKLSLSTLRKWGCAHAVDTEVSCWSMAGAADAGWDVHPIGQDGTPGFCVGWAAFGKVAVLGFNPAGIVSPSGANRRIGDKPGARFWTSILAELLDERKIEFGRRSTSDSSYPYAYEMGEGGTGINEVIEHLQSIPELRPLSIWWVILLLGTLALLLGPVDYLLLKWMGKLPLTWLTSAVWVVLFSVGAYYGVQALRAGAMQVRVVSVVDAVQGADEAWITRYSGIFAPGDDDYQLERTGKYEWWSGVSPTRGELIYGREQGIGSRRIGCLQRYGRNQPVSVPISIWTMQCLLTEGRLDALPFEATVRRAGQQVELTLKNVCGLPIRSVYVRLGANQVARFRGVPSDGGTFTAELSQFSGWDVDTYDAPIWAVGPDRFDPTKAFFAMGTIGRTRAIEARLRKGDAVVCVLYDNPPVEFGVKGRECEYDNVHVARVVVVPQ